MDYRDYYKVLGVSRDATRDEVRKAYRRLASKYHPDISTEPGAETRFKEITEAYEVLKDDKKRRAYDQLGSNWQAGQRFEPPPDWSSQFDFSDALGSLDGFSDFFESLFGGGGFGSNRGFSTNSSNTPRTDRAELKVTLEQLYADQPIEVEFHVQEPSTGGLPQTKVKKLNVKIPSGLSDGETMRLKGQGSMGRDLLLSLKVTPHEHFELDGRDTSTVIALAPWEAVLGASVEVPTLGGPVQLKVRPGTDTSTRMRLKDRGLPGGHHYVSFKIEIPKSVSSKERELFQEISEVSDFDPRAS